MAQQTCKRFLEYRFTEPELMNMREQLASDTIDLDSKRDQKASIAKQFASEIAEIQTRVSSTASKIRSRSEFRDIECAVDYDIARRIKTISRIDTGEIVEEVPMTASELQMELPGIEDDEIETTQTVPATSGLDTLTEVDEPVSHQTPEYNDDFISKMNACKTADEGREIIKDFQNRIIGITNSCGLIPIIGQVNESLYVGFETLHKKQITAMVKAVSKIDPAKGHTLAKIVEQWPAMKDCFDNIRSTELRSRIASPDDIINGKNPDDLMSDQSATDPDVTEDPEY